MYTHNFLFITEPVVGLKFGEGGVKLFDLVTSDGIQLTIADAIAINYDLFGQRMVDLVVFGQGPGEATLQLVHHLLVSVAGRASLRVISGRSVGKMV